MAETEGHQAKCCSVRRQSLSNPSNTSRELVSAGHFRRRRSSIGIFLNQKNLKPSAMRPVPNESAWASKGSTSISGLRSRWSKYFHPCSSRGISDDLRFILNSRAVRPDHFIAPYLRYLEPLISSTNYIRTFRTSAIDVV